MPIRVRDKGRDFIPPPSGLQRAVCCDVVELGIVDTSFGPKRKIKLCWQSENLMDNGKPFLIQQRYTATLHAPRLNPGAASHSRSRKPMTSTSKSSWARTASCSSSTPSRTA